MEDRPDNANFFDGVYIGSPVPMSVFFKGFRPGCCLSFKKTVEVSAQIEAARIRNEERNRQGQVDRLREKRRQQPGFTKARKP